MAARYGLANKPPPEQWFPLRCRLPTALYRKFSKGFAVIEGSSYTMAQILVVDDEFPVRLLIRKVLESAGHSIFEVESGHETLDLLLSHPTPFDLIV